MRIAISGKSGCGNTTVSQLVADKLGYPMINFTFRTLSEEKGIEFWTFCKMAEQSDEYDLEVDRRQVEMAMAVEDCVLGSRLAIWMLKDADESIPYSFFRRTGTPNHRTRRGFARKTERRDGNS